MVPFGFAGQMKEARECARSAIKICCCVCTIWHVQTTANPEGFKETGGSVMVGHGQSVFDDAVQNIKRWRIHERAGLTVTPQGAEVRESTDVILLMKLLIGYVTVSCRVVSVTQSRINGDSPTGPSLTTLSAVKSCSWWRWRLMERSPLRFGRCRGPVIF